MGMPTIHAKLPPGQWRDISTLFTSPASDAVVRVCRDGDRIEFIFEQVTLAGKGIILPWGSLPAGYRPTTNQYGTLHSITGAVEVTFNMGGGLVVNGVTTSGSYRGNFTVHTDASYPASHPGVPA